jgi:hypothetical protein
MVRRILWFGGHRRRTGESEKIRQTKIEYLRTYLGEPTREFIGSHENRLMGCSEDMPASHLQFRAFFSTYLSSLLPCPTHSIGRDRFKPFGP